MKVLSISDTQVSFIYSAQLKPKFGHVDFVIGCGDLSYFYQEFVISTLNIPFFYVRGNHDPEKEFSEDYFCTGPRGGVDLHRRILNHQGVLLAGIEGSIRYKREGKYQYSQSQMWMFVLGLMPKLLLNRIKYGRFLDVFVTHAPPWGIHDKDDLPHQGVKAFRWFLQIFKPAYHFHGHIHIYRPDEIRATRFGETLVLNTYGYLETNLKLAHRK